MQRVGEKSWERGKVLLATLALGAVLAVAGCGSDDEGSSTSTTTETSSTTTADSTSTEDDATTSSDPTPPAAHIQPLSGSANDLPGDGREGTPPPAIAIADLEKAAKAADCELMQNLPDEGNTHLGAPRQAEKNEPDYKTNPPTSGDHVDPGFQQADGAYSEYPDPVLTVHSLEHGRIDMQYSPDLSEDDQLALKGVFDDDPDGMLLFPNPDMPYAVAATAWTQLLGCKTYEGAKTLDAIRDFRDTYRGRGPEPVPVVLN